MLTTFSISHTGAALHAQELHIPHTTPRNDRSDVYLFPKPPLGRQMNCINNHCKYNEEINSLAYCNFCGVCDYSSVSIMA